MSPTTTAFLETPMFGVHQSSFSSQHALTNQGYIELCQAIHQSFQVGLHLMSQTTQKDSKMKKFYAASLCVL